MDVYRKDAKTFSIAKTTSHLKFRCYCCRFGKFLLLDQRKGEQFLGSLSITLSYQHVDKKCTLFEFYSKEYK